MIAHVAPPRQRIGTAVVAALMVGLALVGGIYGVRALAGAATGSSGHGSSHADLPGLAIDVPTSFGVVAVEHAEAIAALRDGDMNMAGGAADAAPTGTMEINTSGVISNLSDTTVDYSPAQFTLVGRGGKEFKVTRSGVGPGTLQPFAAIDVRNVYRVPMGSGPFTVRFSEPGHPDVRISLEDTGDNPRAGSGRTVPAGGVDGKNALPSGGADHHGGN